MVTAKPRSSKVPRDEGQPVGPGEKRALMPEEGCREPRKGERGRI